MSPTAEIPASGGPGPSGQLPPGQRDGGALRAVHYGRVPSITLETWTMTVCGATASGSDERWTWDELLQWPHHEVEATLHCASRKSYRGLRWGGIPARALVEAAPPADGAGHALAYARYGYNSSIALADLMHDDALLATHLGGEPLAPEHGWPMRLIMPHLYGWKGPKWLVAIEYHRNLVRGFWEQRGYHVVGDVWREERYAHLE